MTWTEFAAWVLCALLFGLWLWAEYVGWRRACKIRELFEEADGLLVGTGLVGREDLDELRSRTPARKAQLAREARFYRGGRRGA